MPSIIRISDIPADELYLLPIIGLRQQMREDRSRPRSRANATSKRQTQGPPLAPAQHAKAAAPRESPAAVEGFVTDWQLQDAPRPSARSRFDRENLDDKDFDDSEDEYAGEKEDGLRPNQDRIADEAFDVLYVDLGGEG